jgi:phosphotransferase system HPr-like phosphotransfer protein
MIKYLSNAFGVVVSIHILLGVSLAGNTNKNNVVPLIEWDTYQKGIVSKNTVAAPFNVPNSPRLRNSYDKNGLDIIVYKMINYKLGNGLFSEISESIDKEARSAEHIFKIVNEYSGGINYTYKRELEKNPILKGKLKIVFIILPEGSVIKVDVKESDMNNIEFENAIRDRILKRWYFGLSKSGPVKVVYPFVFDKNN